MNLISDMIRGDRLAVSRAITLIENGDPSSREILRAIYPKTGRAHIVGVTGSPGVGKSSLTNCLVREARAEGLKVGVIAVDPTSPFTGGALLGDRLRMESHALDPGVFIRSLATRGHLGGLSRATGGVINVLDAYGCDVLFVETVGTGQSEVDIMRYAHTVVVVVAPGMGDDVQAMKAGIMEIGDVFAVNKADREGAARTALEIEYMLEMGPSRRQWRPPVIKTAAISGEGIGDLAQKIKEHAKFMRDSGEIEKHALRAAEMELTGILQDALLGSLRRKSRADGRWQDAVAGIASRRIDPFGAAESLLRDYGEDGRIDREGD